MLPGYEHQLGKDHLVLHAFGHIAERHKEELQLAFLGVNQGINGLEIVLAFLIGLEYQREWLAPSGASGGELVGSYQRSGQLGIREAKLDDEILIDKWLEVR